MSKQSCFSRPVDKQHGKQVQILLKSAPEHLYHIYSALATQLSQRKSLLLTYQILGLLLNILGADDKYPALNRENLKIPIEMQLSQKQKTFPFFFFFFFFATLLNAKLNFEHFGRKDDTHRFCVSEIMDSKNVTITINIFHFLNHN